MSPARLSDRLSNAIARLDQVCGYILDPEDAGVISQVAADLNELKLEVEREQWAGLAA